MRKTKSNYIGLIAALLLFVYLIILVLSNQVLLLDEVVTNFEKGIFQESAYPFFKAITMLGGGYGIGIAALIMLAWLWLKKRDYFGMAVFAIAVVLGNELNRWIKELVGRDRPALEHIVDVHSLSFPSGHAMVGLILYMLIAYFLMKDVQSVSVKRWIGLAAFVLILLIGLSRIVLQVHFPTDVLGGYAIGYLWAVLCIFLYEWLYERFPKKQK